MRLPSDNTALSVEHSEVALAPAQALCDVDALEERSLSTMIASEAVSARDWLTEEEDGAWATL